MTHSALLAALTAGASVAVAAAGPSSQSRLRVLSPAPGRVTSRQARRPLVAATLALALVTWSVGLWAACSLAGAVPLAIMIDRRRRSARVVRDVREHVAVVAAAIADEMRAGAVLPTAIRSTVASAGTHLGARLTAAAAAARRGGRVDVALLAPPPLVTGRAAITSTAGDRVDAVLRPLAATLALAQSGAALADVLDSVAAAHRADERIRAAVNAELAAPRASAALLAMLPVLGIALGAAAGAQPLTVLFHTGLGAGCLAGGVVLDACGVAWSLAIAGRAVR